MRRTSSLVLLVAVLLAGLVVSGLLTPGTVAQEATPAGEEFVPEGTTFEPLAFGTADEVPVAPADLVLARFTIEPGAGFPLEADDPSLALAYIESGTLTVQADVPIQVIRAATMAVFATPGAIAEDDALPGAEEVAAGTEFTLEAGDSAIFPPHVEGEIRNDGQERAVALVSLVAPLENGGGTPTP